MERTDDLFLGEDLRRASDALIRDANDVTLRDWQRAAVANLVPDPEEYFPPDLADERDDDFEPYDNDPGR